MLHQIGGIWEKLIIEFALHKSAKSGNHGQGDPRAKKQEINAKLHAELFLREGRPSSSIDKPHEQPTATAETTTVTLTPASQVAAREAEAAAAAKSRPDGSLTPASEGAQTEPLPM